MAQQKECSKTDPTNYREPENNDVGLHVQQLLSGTLQIDQCAPIRDLERIKIDGNQALVNSHFSTPQEKKMAERLQRNTDGWIDTAKDVTIVAVDVVGLIKTCGPAISAGSITPIEVTHAIQHVTSIKETLKRIYDRSCDMAINNSYELLESVNEDENISENLAIKAAAEEHQNDLGKFRRGEVNANVPQQSHAKLHESIRKIEPNPQSEVRRNAEKSSRAWDLVKGLGTVVLAVGVIAGLVLLKH